MGKSTPAAPAAPDPVVTAAAQTRSNIDTANAQANLNHTNQNTPYGSQNWSSTPNADGTSSWTSTTSLAPEQQHLLDSSNRISQNMANLGESQLGTVANTMGQPLNYNNAPAQVTNVQQGALATNAQGGTPLQSSAQGGTPLQTSASYGHIQDNVDMSGVPKLVGGDDLQKTFGDAQKAAYGMQSQYLDSDYSQRQHDLENKLVQQGVLQGSDAWNRETQNLGKQRTFDYNNAFNNSFDKGQSAQGQLYNQGLASNQNAYGQAVGNGNFHNAAQQQGFGQSMANAQLNNAASGQTFNQNLANAGLNNSASGQTFGQNLANAGLYNTANGQYFNQGITNAALNNQGRTQSINESNYLRQQPLNELNALRTGSQVTAPQFGGTPQGNVQGTDLAGLYNQQYQNQLASYNAGVAGNNQMTGGLFGLGAAALMSPVGTFGSDRTIKENIVKVGARTDGIGIYDFDYKPEFKDAWGAGRYRGVMADEVEQVMPHAVALHPDGYKMVNYEVLNA